MRQYNAFAPGPMENFYGTIVSISPEAALSLGSMEGMIDIALAEVPRRSLWQTFLQSPWFGYTVAGAVTLAAFALSKLPYMPGLTMLAIILGVIVRNISPMPATVSLGCRRIVHTCIPVAIVLTGAGLSFSELSRISGRVAVVASACIVIALAGSYLLARWLGLTRKTAALLGIGTGICGSSAIVAAAPLVKADEQDVVLSIGAVNLFGLLLMLAMPAMGAVLALEPTAFGVWAGTTIHAVPQVLAAATGYDMAGEALQIATLVKLGRVAMLAPIVFCLALITVRSRDAVGRRIHYARLVPWFVWGFLIMALLNTLSLLPELHFTAHGRVFSLAALLEHHLGKLLLTIALAAIGLEVRLSKLLSVGARAVVAGLLSTLLLVAASLALVMLLL